MALTLVTGRANTGKTGLAYEALGEAVARSLAPTLLLPTRPDVTRATAELSAKHPVGLAVRQIDEWASELWSLHGDGRAPVEHEQRLLLLREVVGSAELSVLARSARTRGFVGLLARLAQLAAEQQPCASGGNASSPMDGEILRLLGSYRAALDARGLIEPAEASWTLARQPPPAAGPIVAHRFSDLSPSQEALLVALAETGEEVLVTLPWERDFPATEALDGLVGRLAQAGRHRHLEAAPARDELERLEALLFRPARPAAVGEQVRFCTAAGPEAEAVLVASEAARAAEAYGADRVAVVLHDAVPRVGGIARALAGEGLAVDLDVLVPFPRTALGAALFHVMAGVRGDAASLVAFLRGPFSGAAPDDVDRLDARWRRDGPPDPATAPRSAAALGAPAKRAIRAAERASHPRAAWENWKELADALIAACYDHAQLGIRPEADMDASAHRTVVTAARRLAGLAGGAVDAASVLDVLQDARVQGGPSERPGHVQVTEARRLRGRRFDAVIIADLTARGFAPEERLCTASELASRLFALEPRNDRAVEKMLFYTVCTRARERLVLTRQSADAQGDAVRPSVFWDEALDLYRAPDPDADELADDGPVVRSVSLSDLEEAAPALTPGRAALRAVAAAGPRPQRRSRGLEDEQVLAALAARQVFSATELESYTRCPYRWFYEKAVRPDGLDVTFDARSRGDLAHRVLARLYGISLPEAGIARVTAERLPEALLLADAAFEIESASADTPAPATLREHDELARVRLRVREIVAEDVTFLEGFSPSHVELRFGLDAGEEGEAQDGRDAVDLGGFLLRGSIDRVDEGDAGVVVTDYKSGGMVPKRADIEGERYIQVALYAAAARRLLGRPIVAGLYRSLKNGGGRGFFRSDLLGGYGLTSTDALRCEEELEALLSSALLMAAEAAEGIRAGEIAPAPASAKACQYCRASAVCGRGV